MFTPNLPTSELRRGAFANITARLIELSESELIWIDGVLAAALKRPEEHRVAASKPTEEARGKSLSRIRVTKLRR